MTLSVALIGAGAMAARHAAIVEADDQVRLDVIVDNDPARAAELARRTGALATADLEHALTCDLAIVANATCNHHRMALPLITAGVPVLVEKPLAARADDIYDLVNAANRLDRVLMCGFVERFNARFAPIAALAREPLTAIRTNRVSPPPARAHSGVVDDILLHDLDLVLRLAGDATVVDVGATSDHWPTGAPWPEAVGCQLRFSNGTEATMTASRVAPRRERQFIASTSSRSVTVDLDDPSGNPLAAQFHHFVDLALNGTAATRAAERIGTLPAHELSARINEALAVQR